MLNLSAPYDKFHAMVRASLSQDAGQPLRWPLTLVRHGPFNHELLVRELELWGAIDPDVWLVLHWVETLPGQAPEVTAGEAAIWITVQGDWCGMYRPQDTMGLRWPAEAITELRLPGAGLHVLQTKSVARLMHYSMDNDIGSRHGWLMATAPSRDPQGQSSRTVGAIGQSAVENLRQSDFAVVGCSRNGIPIATLLATYQPHSLTLVDFKTIKAGNLDAGFAATGLHNPESEELPGIFKVEALAMRLRELTPLTRVTSMARSVLEPAVMAQLALCSNVIVSTVDDDTARMACDIVAKAFHRPHLAIGSMVTQDGAGNRLLGADIRLTLPGKHRCLCCLGGFAQGTRIEAFAQGRPLPVSADWREEKDGALSSWSTMVAGLSMRLLEDLACARITESTWLRLTHTGNSPVPRIEQLTAAPDPYCPICSIAGLGPEILHRLPALAAGVVIRMKRRGEMKDVVFS